MSYDNDRDYVKFKIIKIRINDHVTYAIIKIEVYDHD